MKLGAGGDSAASEIIVAHELGHSFGLKHVTDANNLMYPSTSNHPPCLPGLSDDQVHALDDVSIRADDRASLQRKDGVLAVRDVIDSVIEAARERAAQQ